MVTNDPVTHARSNEALIKQADSSSEPASDNGSGKQTVLLDLHCHSDVSDGYYPPEAVAEMTARAGAAYAALTDHRSTDGFWRFRAAAIRNGVTAITGTELHALFEGSEIHLLAYGFDPDSDRIRQLVESTHDVSEALTAVHEAGGIVLLAHPLQAARADGDLEKTVARLADMGLDGIEAYYKPYATETQNQLVALADRLGILTCGGSDFHGPRGPGISVEEGPVVEMPVERWKQFREALGNHESRERNTAEKHQDEAAPSTGIPGTIDWRWLFLRIVLPSLLVIGFFVTLLFAVHIPVMEEKLLDRKRETVMELTNVAWSILDDYNREVTEGVVDIQEAQQAAANRIRRLRYGPEGKDYFWITDMHPKMVMHPYREDLEGTDLSDFTDSEGIRPFVEFVNTVKQHNSGFVWYVWQWQDDPDRFEAKESYVRAFEPWGWVIGTGLYVDDVTAEIEAITGWMIDVSFIATVLAAALLFTVAYQSLQVERRRSEAERELHLSHERYRALVESSTAGILLLVDGRCTYANSSLLDMIGCSAQEIAFLDIQDIILSRGPNSGEAHSGEQLELIAAGEAIREPFEARLQRTNGQTVPILLSSTPVYFSGRQGLLLSIQDISRHRAMQSETERDHLVTQLQTSLLFLTEPVRNSMDSPVSCPLHTPISQAVRLMNRHNTDALMITGPDGDPLGIITDFDIRGRVVAQGIDIALPVSRIMSAPVVTVDESTPVFEAILLEQDRSIDHLAVTDGSDNLVGILRSSRLVRPDRYSLVILTQQIRKASTVEGVAECRERLPALVVSLVDSGVLPRSICHVTTAVSDAATKRVIDLAVEELGTPPCRFAFIALGSEARREQTLATDQDNALIYEDSKEEEAARYFLDLGTLICDGLDRVGYRYCKGGNMANNPQWNQPIEHWKRYFTRWIAEPNDKALVHCNVFFDWRFIHGDVSLLDTLREHVIRVIAEYPAFLSYMARNTLRYKPPVGLFGRIVTGSAGERKNTFNIKEAMLPIVNFARLYALQHQLEQTNTFSRLEQLHSIGILQDESFRATIQAYSHLMQLRYRRQTDQLKAGMPVNNSIDPATLTQIETGMLKWTFSQISVIQKKVGFEFHAVG